MRRLSGDCSPPVPATQFGDTTGARGRRYGYRVRALNPVGSSALSAGATAPRG